MAPHEFGIAMRWKDRQMLDETYRLWENCREELSGLQRCIRELERCCATSLDCINEAPWILAKAEAKRAPAEALPRESSYYTALLSKAEEMRVFAESVKDGAVRNLLFELADDYERQAQEIVKASSVSAQ